MGADFLGLGLDILVVTVPWAAEFARLPRWPGAPRCHGLFGRAEGSGFPRCQQMCWFPVGPQGLLLSSQSMLSRESHTSCFRNFSSFSPARAGLPPSPSAGGSAQHCRVLHIGLPYQFILWSVILQIYLAQKRCLLWVDAASHSCDSMWTRVARDLVMIGLYHVLWARIKSFTTPGTKNTRSSGLG